MKEYRVKHINGETTVKASTVELQPAFSSATFFDEAGKLLAYFTGVSSIQQVQ